MDEDRFDELVRRFGQSSRRGLLGGALGALVGEGVLRTVTAAKNRGKRGRKAKVHRKKRPGDDQRSQSGAAEAAAELRDPESRASPRPGSLVIDYFALGDSIAAGHGLGDTGDGTGQPCTPKPEGERCCRRSRRAHPFKLKDLLAERSIAVANLEHKACSGSKIQDLDAQIAAVEAFVARQRRPKRPLLVTVSIGGNDAGLTDPKFVLDLLYVMTDDQFEDWLVVLDLLSYDLTERLTRLLQLPDVVVALNEVVNPLNRKSVFFNAPNDDGTMCKDPRNPFAEKRRCWDRFETVINTLNTAYRNQIADLRTRFPGRIVMTERLKDDFSRHWGAPGVEGGQIGLVCNVILGRPVCYPGRVYREECGYQNPVAGAQSTWVQSRTSRDSNSKPFAFTWSWSYFLSLVGRPIMGLPSDWKGDCVHPNDDGQAAIARHLDQAISRLNWNAVRRCGDGPPCAQGETCVAGACITGEEYRIVLTWGAEPRDLDSHLWLPATSPYEVYYSDRGQLDAFPYAELDTDDTTSFGPETITISRLQPGEYTYAVHLFSGTETIGTSGATVRLFRGGTLIGTYTPPPSGPWSEDNGTYVWWHVFTLDSDGTITEVNASSTDPSPYLQSQAFSEDVSTRALPPKTTGSSNDKESGHTGRRDKRTKQTRRRKQRAHR